MAEKSEVRERCPNCDEFLYYSLEGKKSCLACGYIRKSGDNEPVTLTATLSLTLTDAHPKVVDYVRHHLNGASVAMEADAKLYTLNSAFVSWFLFRIFPGGHFEDFEEWYEDWDATAVITRGEDKRPDD